MPAKKPEYPCASNPRGAEAAGSTWRQSSLWAEEERWKGGCPADTSVEIAGGGNWQFSDAQRRGIRAVQHCWRLGLAAVCVVGFLNFKIPERR